MADPTQPLAPPAWLILDEVVPVELRSRVPECNEAATRLLNTVLDFAEEWLPFLDDLDRAIDRSRDVVPRFDLDGWSDYIKKVIGVDVADDQIDLALWTMSRLEYDSMPTDRHYKDLYEHAATPEQRARLDALTARPARGVSDALQAND